MRYRLHGMVIESALPLPGPDANGEAPDLVVDMVRGRVTGVLPATSPDDEILIDGPGYMATRRNGTTRIVFPDLCAFDITGTSVLATVDPAADLGMAAILASGNLVSTIYGLRGRGVLHASTVASGGRGIAFAGPSGAGKSTMAAMLCRAGASLVGDDVLVVETHEQTIMCLPGSTHIRLRPDAGVLAGDTRSDTADRRIACHPATVTDPVPLHAIVIPRPVRDQSDLRITRLSPADATMQLAAATRIGGWKLPSALRAQFELSAHLGRSVPVYEAYVPWGPPFVLRIADQLIGMLA